MSAQKEKKNSKPQSTDKKVLVLLDAHAILHRAYHALPEFSTSKGEPTGALYGLVAMLLKIIGELKPDYIAACYDLPGPTYRHEAYEKYKAQRKKAEDDLIAQINRSRDIFEAINIPIYSEPGFEADDVLGTIVEINKNFAGKIIIASGDMDTLQLVKDDRVVVYTLKKGISDTILYNEKRVEERFGFHPKFLTDYKGLRGDPSDNIIGIPGIGEKTATILIQSFGTIEEIYKVLKKNPDKLKEARLTDRIINLLKDYEEEAIFSKMLATIRRDAPINFIIPTKTWKESFNIEKASSLFTDLEFRTFGNRLKELLKKETSEGSNPKSEQMSLNSVSNVNVDKKELDETILALWILDSNIPNPTLDDILNFAKTRDFKKARDLILDEIRKRNLTFVFEQIEKPLMPIVRKMEEWGIKIDNKYLKKLSIDYHKELKFLEKNIWKGAEEEFNINSPQQLGRILFEKLNLRAKNQKKTGTGMKSTRESELHKMQDLHPIIPLILEYREFQKLLSTYIDNIPLLLDSNQRLHTSLRQIGAATGRMSSTNPNIQNIPIKTELGRNIRKAFIAEKGFVLASFDYSQIELRVAAILSGDKKLLEIFRKGEDIHTAVASAVFGVPLNKVDKEMRRKAKVINFGILYGMGVNALRQNLGGTREEAQKFYNEYFEKFPDLAKYLDVVKVRAEREGYTETLFGRRRYFEGIKSKIPYIRAAAERMAINAPLQGTAADIIKLAMVNIADHLRKEKLEEKTRMLLQVHDELVFEVEEKIIHEVAPQIKKIMEEALPKEKSRGIVMEANAAYGFNWNEMQQI
ncbi:MAG TPA: DNA polymerase [Candidatus Paceibacterota bacterium]